MKPVNAILNLRTNTFTYYDNCGNKIEKKLKKYLFFSETEGYMLGNLIKFLVTIIFKSDYSEQQEMSFKDVDDYINKFVFNI